MNDDFAAKCKTLLSNLKTKGIIMVPIEGCRSLEDQARDYRKGRSLQQISLKIQELRNNDASFLADVLYKVGPSPETRIVTNAIPGYSWHEWGCALDCYVSINGKLVADPKDPLFQTALTQYRAYADEAVDLGLTAGYYFHGRLQDLAHIQLYKQEIPSLMTLQQVDTHFNTK